MSLCTLLGNWVVKGNWVRSTCFTRLITKTTGRCVSIAGKGICQQVRYNYIFPTSSRVRLRILTKVSSYTTFNETSTPGVFTIGHGETGHVVVMFRVSTPRGFTFTIGCAHFTIQVGNGRTPIVGRDNITLRGVQGGLTCFDMDQTRFFGRVNVFYWGLFNFIFGICGAMSHLRLDYIWGQLFFGGRNFTIIMFWGVGCFFNASFGRNCSSTRME